MRIIVHRVGRYAVVARSEDLGTDLLKVTQRVYQVVELDVVEYIREAFRDRWTHGSVLLPREIKEVLWTSDIVSPSSVSGHAAEELAVQQVEALATAPLDSDPQPAAHTA